MSVRHLDGRRHRRCTRSAEDVTDELDGLESRVLRRCERRREELDLAQPLPRELRDPSLGAERQLHGAGHGNQLVLVLHAASLGDEIVDRHRVVEGSDARDADPPMAELAAGPDELR